MGTINPILLAVIVRPLLIVPRRYVGYRLLHAKVNKRVLKYSM